MPQAYSTKAFNIFVLAIIDGPCEDSVYDSLFELALKELRAMMPPLVDGAGGALTNQNDSGGCGGLHRVSTWRFDDKGNVIGKKTLTVYVLLTGLMADGPMRNKIFKNIQWSGLRPCDICTLLGEKGSFNATKFFGCVVPSDRTSR